jgi:hypothetical protein
VAVLPRRAALTVIPVCENPGDAAARHEAGRREQETVQDADSADIVAARVEEHADLVLRCAWLRSTGHHLYGVDPGGMLSAQLYDFADLLEVLETEGRWDAHVRRASQPRGSS